MRLRGTTPSPPNAPLSTRDLKDRAEDAARRLRQEPGRLDLALELAQTLERLGE